MRFYDDTLYYMPRQATPYNTGMMQQPAAQMPTLPPGVPGGMTAVPAPVMPSIPIQIQQGTEGPPAETLQSPQYVAGFLKSQIGKTVRVEFLIGSTGPLVDRVGTLIGVGASYILIQPIESDDILMADLYSIKFVTISL